MVEGATREEERERSAERLAKRMGRVGHKMLVLSGKGGVGKSTVAVNLAVALKEAGRRVGVLDVDVHGPSVPKLLGLDSASVSPGPKSADGEMSMLPVVARGDADGIKVMSIAFLLRGRSDPVIWRGPMKHGAIGQLLSDVEWGELDYLVIDAPPGTGDEPLSVCQLVPDADGAVVVTTPQDLSVADVRRSIGFCRQLGMKVLGVIENMSGFVCPNCGERVDVFKTGGGHRLAQECRVPFLGAVPLDPAIARISDEGKPFVRLLKGSAAAEAFSGIVSAILGSAGEARPGRTSAPARRVASGGRPASSRAPAEPDASGPARQDPGPPARRGEQMPERTGAARRFAIPMAQGKLSLHFGHCESFALVDAEDGKVVSREDVEAPGHQPGLLPRWLKELGANVIIAGGMGQRAQSLFAGHGIEVAIGAARGEPEELVKAYLAGTLATGENICDH